MVSIRILLQTTLRYGTVSYFFKVTWGRGEKTSSLKYSPLSCAPCPHPAVLSLPEQKHILFHVIDENKKHKNLTQSLSASAQSKNSLDSVKVAFRQSFYFSVNMTQRIALEQANITTIQACASGTVQ